MCATTVNHNDLVLDDLNPSDQEQLKKRQSEMRVCTQRCKHSRALPLLARYNGDQTGDTLEAFAEAKESDYEALDLQWHQPRVGDEPAGSRRFRRIINP